jgi:ribonuclease HII
MNLFSFNDPDLIEAGCDEAGRGCLAGPVFAAAVILPKDFEHDWLKDSKKMTERRRYMLRDIIQQNAIAWAVGEASEAEIEKMNIANASYLAMHRAIKGLKMLPQMLLVDGKYFKSYTPTPHICVIKGDNKFASIAAASVLAKTYRDDHMKYLAQELPFYEWEVNKGYPTQRHQNAILQFGVSLYHRKSFKLAGETLNERFNATSVLIKKDDL